MKRRIKKKLVDFKLKGKPLNKVEMKANVPKFKPVKADYQKRIRSIMER